MGSQLRGAFGYALKKVTCINPSFRCESCFAQSNCLYYTFYEQKNSFHNYRFDFKLGVEFYEFSIYLFEDATLQLPYVVSALHQMLTHNGLGKDRVKFNDFQLYINDEDSYKNKQLQISKDGIKTLKIDKNCQDVILHFQTPLRIKKENRFIRDDSLELQDIINSIYQRQMKLLRRGYKKFPYEIKGEIVKKDLHYKELTRRSNRQKTTMNLGGIMGSVVLQKLSKECYEVLKVGELIGVGKQTTFGLGKIEVECSDG